MYMVCMDDWRNLYFTCTPWRELIVDNYGSLWHGGDDVDKQIKAFFAEPIT